MYQAFETDVMEDLYYDAAEGPATRHYDEYDAGDYADEYDDMDAAEEDDDAFLGGLVRGVGQVASSVLGGDEFDEMEGMDEYEAMDEYEGMDEYDEYDAMGEVDAMDEFEEAMADALEAEDTDEFLRRFRRVANIARRVGRGVGRVARVVAPIASAIPLPQAQAIGRIAGVAGRLLADGADEFEAIDEMVDLAEEEDAIDAAAPLIAGLALRAAAPRIARAALPVRRQAVRAVTRSVQTLARRQGAPAARAAVRVARAVTRRGLPARRIAPAVRRVTSQVARRPGAVRRLSRPLSTAARPGRAGAGMRRRQPGRTRPGMVGGMRRRMPGYGAGATGYGVGVPGSGSGYGVAPRQRVMGRGAACPNCGRVQRYNLRGPVSLTIHSH